MFVVIEVLRFKRNLMHLATEMNGLWVDSCLHTSTVPKTSCDGRKPFFLPAGGPWTTRLCNPEVRCFASSILLAAYVGKSARTNQRRTQKDCLQRTAVEVRQLKIDPKHMAGFHKDFCSSVESDREYLWNAMDDPRYTIQVMNKCYKRAVEWLPSGIVHQLLRFFVDPEVHDSDHPFRLRFESQSQYENWITGQFVLVRIWCSKHFEQLFIVHLSKPFGRFCLNDTSV
eukprot:6352733-Amphidinium_carterae.1